MPEPPPDRVREALAHLYDPGYLQTHPLAAAAGGKAKRSALEPAVDALKTGRDGKGGPLAWPFAGRPANLVCEGRRLPERFADEAAKRAALGRAPWVTLRVRLGSVGL